SSSTWWLRKQARQDGASEIPRSRAERPIGKTAEADTTGDSAVNGFGARCAVGTAYSSRGSACPGSPAGPDAVGAAQLCGHGRGGEEVAAGGAPALLHPRHRFPPLCVDRPRGCLLAKANPPPCSTVVSRRVLFMSALLPS